MVRRRKHIERLLIVIISVVAVLFFIRALLIPQSFGRYGYYRGDSLKEQADLPLVYLESAFCEDCHKVQYGDWKNNSHSSVICETCHGHWEIHNGRVKTMTAIKSDDACTMCHQKLAGRPDSFPQIVSLTEHIEDKEIPEEGAHNCLSCHDPHVPLQ